MLLCIWMTEFSVMFVEDFRGLTDRVSEKKQQAIKRQYALHKTPPVRFHTRFTVAEEPSDRLPLLQAPGDGLSWFTSGLVYWPALPMPTNSSTKPPYFPSLKQK